MLRSYIAYFLILSLLSANLSRYFVYVGFEFNKNYIAATLCENRDKPVLQCNGKCYLSKQLKRQADNEKKQERESKKSNFHDASITDRFELLVAFSFVRKQIVPELPFVLPVHSVFIFHPPQISA